MMASILDGHIRRKVCEYIKAHMPPKGDTPIKVADQALACHGLYLKRVYQNFRDNKPGGVVYNLLQLRECQMILALDLTAADGSGVAHHCIGWNGTALLDRPHNMVIEEMDRSHPKFARIVFDKLYPKETYEGWKVVQAFAIDKISNKKTRTTRKRKRSAKTVVAK